MIRGIGLVALALVLGTAAGTVVSPLAAEAHAIKVYGWAKCGPRGYAPTPCPSVTPSAPGMRTQTAYPGHNPLSYGGFEFTGVPHNVTAKLTVNGGLGGTCVYYVNVGDP